MLPLNLYYLHSVESRWKCGRFERAGGDRAREKTNPLVNFLVGSLDKHQGDNFLLLFVVVLV